jgi:hypothetical protein
MNTKTIDIDSTYRNRENYPNPYDFVIPYKAKQEIVSTSFLDPILESSPYTGSTTRIPGQLLTGISFDAQNITLDPEEVTITNYYISSKLQIGNQTRIITFYDGVTKVATVDSPFPLIPASGTVYFIRKLDQYFSSDVTIYRRDVATNTVSQLNLLSVDASITNNFYTGSFIRYTNGPHATQTALITDYFTTDTPPWIQPTNEGVVADLSTLERGWLFTQSAMAILKRIQFVASGFDSTGSRTLVVRVRSGSGFTGSILYTTTLTVSSATPVDFSTVDINTLLSAGTYTFTLQDTTIGGDATGYIKVYGITPDSTFIALDNFPVYPKLTVTSYSFPPVTVASQPVDTPVSLLGGVTNSVYASYSTRLTNSGYTGKCMRVRRSMDNSQTDIGFIAGGLDLFALKTFSAGGDVFVSILYDQSGKGNHLTQTLIGSQPRIVTAGTVESVAGVPALLFDGINDFLNLPGYPFIGKSSFSVSVVQRLLDFRVGARVFSFGTTIFATNDNTTIGGGGLLSINNGTGAQTTSYTSTGDMLPHGYVYTHSGSDLSVYRDGVNIGSTGGITTLPSSTFGTTNYIGRSVAGDYFYGNISEIVVFDVALSSLDAIYTSNNQTGYYS